MKGVKEMESQVPEEPCNPPAVRRPYVRPHVRIYGTLQDVTRSSLTMNKNDPGNSATTRT